MNQEAKRELLKDYSATIYSHISHARLHTELKNEEWDSLPDEWAESVYNAVELLVNQKFNELEAQKEMYAKTS